MLLKVELNFEDARRVRHRSRRQPMGVDIQGAVRRLSDPGHRGHAVALWSPSGVGVNT
jgi:hypothetical protein